MRVTYRISDGHGFLRALKIAGPILCLSLVLVWGPGCGFFGDDSGQPESGKVTAPVKSPQQPKAEEKKPEPEPITPEERLKQMVAAKEEAEPVRSADLLDPFLPIEAALPKQPAATGTEKPEELKTPLERVELSELKLVAIVVADGMKKAMVQDNAGTGFIIEVGTPMGRKGGTVAEIKPNEVIVNEEMLVGRGVSKTRKTVPYTYKLKKEEKQKMVIKITGGESQ